MSRDFAVVFRGTLVEAEIVRTVLAQVGIRSMIEHDQIATMLPQILEPYGHRPVRILVNAEQADAARDEIERAKR